MCKIDILFSSVSLCKYLESFIGITDKEENVSISVANQELKIDGFDCRYEVPVEHKGSGKFEWSFRKIKNLNAFLKSVTDQPVHIRIDLGNPECSEIRSLIF